MLFSASDHELLLNRLVNLIPTLFLFYLLQAFFLLVLTIDE